MKNLFTQVLILMCFVIANAQDLSLGDQIFIDQDNNGIYESFENGAAGVTVNLWSAASGFPEEIVESYVTDVDGKYFFENLDSIVYLIEIPAENFEEGGALHLFQTCEGDAHPQDGVDNDDNGGANLFSEGAVWSQLIDMAMAEPTIDLSVTVDFCFYYDAPTYDFSHNCDEASEVAPICTYNALNTLTGSMFPEISGGPVPNPLCPDGGAPHNMTWFSFVPGSADFSFEIIPFNCTFNDAFIGIQVGVYTDCSFTESVLCQSECETAPVTIAPVSVDWIIGDTYYVFLDGCAGSVCEFEIENITGTLSCDTNNPPSYDFSSNCENAAEVDPICTYEEFASLSGSMFTETSTGSTPSPLCPTGGGAHNMTWFSFVPGSVDFSFDIVPSNCTTNEGFTGIQVGVYTDCSFTQSVYCQETCSADPVTIPGISVNWTPGETYYAFLDGCLGNVCDFSIENVTGLLGCDISTEDCDFAQQIFADTPDDCDEGENILNIDGQLSTNEGIANLPCLEDGAPVNWYNIVINDPNTDYIMAQVDADGFDPVWAFYVGDDCDNLTLVPAVDTATTFLDCSYSDGIIGNPHYVPYVQGNTYWIAVSSIGTVTDPSYTLYYSSFLDCASCTGELLYDCKPNQFTAFVDGVESNGPFAANAEVTICVEVDWDLSMQGNVWIHGIIPNFGSGWDVTSAGPANVNLPGSWEWVDAEGDCATRSSIYELPNICSYDEEGILKICNKACDPSCPCDSPLEPDSPLPSGWFSNSNGGSPTCVGGSCIPLDNYGIAGGSSQLIDYCYDLRVKDISNINCTGDRDLQISYIITSDAITGCWEDDQPCINPLTYMSPEWKVDCEAAPAPDLIYVVVCADDLPYDYEGIIVDENSSEITIINDYILPNTPAADGGDSIVDISIEILDESIQFVVEDCDEEGYTILVLSDIYIGDVDSKTYVWIDGETDMILGEGLDFLVPNDVTLLKGILTITKHGTSCSYESESVLDFSPNIPLGIDGPEVLCADNAMAIYTVIPFDDISTVDYEWEITGGVGEFVSNNSTNQIIVEWLSDEGQLCVNAMNDCAESDQVCIEVISVSGIDILPPLGISGETELCEDSPTTVYTAMEPDDENITDYVWIITEGTGAITDLTLINQAFVNWTSPTGTICVFSEGDCGMSDPICVDVTISDVPTPDFSWWLIDGSDDEVLFTYTDAEEVDSYLWDFGDGNTSTEMSPTHMYENTDQVYTVTVTVTKGGCTQTASLDVEIIVDDVYDIKQIESLVISPNPNNGLFYIDMELSEAIDLQVQIMDIHGRLTQEYTLPSQSNNINQTIDMAEASSGAYLVRFVSIDGVRTERVVVD